MPQNASQRQRLGLLAFPLSLIGDATNKIAAIILAALARAREKPKP